MALCVTLKGVTLSEEGQTTTSNPPHEEPSVDGELEVDKSKTVYDS